MASREQGHGRAVGSEGDGAERKKNEALVKDAKGTGKGRHKVAGGRKGEEKINEQFSKVRGNRRPCKPKVGREH